MSDSNKPTENQLSRRGMITAVGAGTLATAIASQPAAAQTKPRPFNPNRLTFEQGIQRIKDAVENRLPAGKIVTSQDDGVDKIVDALEITNIPDGFVKYQLPVAFQGGPGAQFFLSIGHPRTEVKPHSHDEGDGMRFIVSGSIQYNGKELRGGDWMYIPKGADYSFNVGDHGAVIFYCYQCCCA